MGKGKSRGGSRSHRNERTSPRVATKASKLLSNPKTSKTVKTVAASALTQTRNRPKRRK